MSIAHDTCNVQLYDNIKRLKSTIWINQILTKLIVIFDLELDFCSEKTNNWTGLNPNFIYVVQLSILQASNNLICFLG